jgi:hypothetical protein
MKSYLMVVAPGRVWLIGERDSELLLADPDGWVEALIELMDGKHRRSSLCHELSARWPGVSEEEVATVIGVLDAAGFVDEAEVWAYLRAPRWTKYELASWGEVAHVAMSG